MRAVFRWFKDNGYEDATGYMESIGVDVAMRSKISDALIAMP